MTRQLEDLTITEIKAAIPAVFPDDGHAEAYQLLDAVAEKLYSSRSEVPDGYRRNRVWELYIGRVKAALVKLAAEGTLIRVGAKDRPPDGTSPGRVSYWTPEAYEAAKVRRNQAAAEAQRAEERWDQVASRLSAVQVHLKPNGSLSLEDWEHLLEATGL